MGESGLSTGFECLFAFDCSSWLAVVDVVVGVVVVDVSSIGG